MTPFEKAVQHNEEKYQNLTDTAKWAKEVGIDQIAQHVVEVDIFESYINLCIPPGDLALLRKIRRLLGHNWKYRRSHINESNGSKFMHYQHKNNYKRDLNILIDSSLAGQSCQRVQIGTKEIPVYQIVCN